MCSKKTRTKLKLSFGFWGMVLSERRPESIVSAQHEPRFNGRKSEVRANRKKYNVRITYCTLVYVCMCAWTHFRYGDDDDTIIISCYCVLGTDENDGERNSWTSGIFPINRAGENYEFQYRSTGVSSEPANTVTVRCSRLRILNTTVVRNVYYYYYTLYA